MSILKNIRYRIEYAFYLLVEFILGALPIEIASAVSGRLWRLIAPLTRRHDRAIEHLRAAFPDKSREDCDRIARDMWENLGRVFGEFFHLEEIDRGDRIDARAVVEALAAHSERGAVVCGGHQGNWEVGVMAPVRLGARPTGIYQRITNPYVDARVLARREPFYPGGLYAKSANAGVQAMRNIRRGGFLAMLVDLRDRTGVNVPFFGRPAPSTTFPAQVARLLNVPLVACFVTREPGVRFRLELEFIDVPRTEDREADAKTATAALQAAFERSIRKRPEQWMWAHRRWG